MCVLFWLQLMRGVFYQVVAGGTADTSGVKANDGIATMNGQDASKMTVVQAQDVIKAAGTTFTLGVTR